VGDRWKMGGSGVGLWKGEDKSLRGDGIGREGQQSLHI
jgi:hypothetical protein